jgi:hypothetical protein
MSKSVKKAKSASKTSAKEGEKWDKIQQNLSERLKLIEVRKEDLYKQKNRIEIV